MAPKKRLFYQDTKAKFVVREAVLSERQKQLLAAVEFCKTNNCKGQKAISSGICPLIKDRRTIDKALQEGCTASSSQTFSGRKDSILTPEEELQLVAFIKNKNRAGQGLKRDGARRMVHDILTIRKKVNMKIKGGRRYVPLSRAANNFLITKRLSKSFWRKLEIRHNLTRKRQGSAAAQRVLACTRDMAERHLDELAEECIRLGIFTEHKQEAPGVWTGKVDLSRIYNHDEMPQFLNYGVDGQQGGLTYCGRGEKCVKYTRENRECVTIEPFVSLSGSLDVCHVIFPAKCITSQMAPETAVKQIRNLLVSTTESGYQDHNTCLAVHKTFKKAILEKEGKLPVISLTDGHSTRFDPEVLRFCRKSEINQFLGPPNTTSSTQVLDQLFALLHAAYNDQRDLLFDEGVNRERFMLILADIWNEWATPERIQNAAKRCGISSSGFNVNDMDQEPFERARLLLQKENSQSTPSKFVDTPEEMTTPTGMRKDTKAYWKWKATAAIEYVKHLKETPISPEEVMPDLMSVRRAAPVMRETRKSVRLSGTHGSMEAGMALEKVEEKRKQEEEKEKEKERKRGEKEEQVGIFSRCEKACMCKTKECKASALKKCQSCGRVLKSQCQQKSCMGENGDKPKMLLPACKRKFLKVDEVYSSCESGESDWENDDPKLDLGDSWDDSETSDEDISSKCVALRLLKEEAGEPEPKKTRGKSNKGSIFSCDFCKNGHL